MHLLLYLSISCALCISAFAAPVEQDSYLERAKLLTGGKTMTLCDQNKDDLSDCLKQVFEEALPYMAKGIPELNIPPSEPLLLNRTTIEFNLNNINGRVTLKNAAISGMTSSELKKVDFQTKNGGIKMTVHSLMPLIRILGNYKAELTINNRLHFKPRGNFNLTLHDVDMISTTEGKFYEKDGHKFVRLHKIDANPKIGNLDIDVSGIFDDPELSELAGSLAKQYWREAYATLLPQTRNFWEPLALQMLNEVLSVIPYDAFVKSE